MADWIRSKTNLAHSLYATLSDQNGPIDLPVGTSVAITTRLLGNSALTTSATAAVVAPGAPLNDPERGQVRYDPVAQDVENQGVYYVKWHVQMSDQPDGYIQSYPEDGPMILIILPDQ